MTHFQAFDGFFLSPFIRIKNNAEMFLKPTTFQLTNQRFLFLIFNGRFEF